MLLSLRRTLTRTFACAGMAVALLFGAARSQALQPAITCCRCGATCFAADVGHRVRERLKKTADDAIASTSLASVTSDKSVAAELQWQGRADGGGGADVRPYGDIRYRNFVIAVNRFIIGSEDSSSTNGTSSGDKLLATMRQISAYVLAADWSAWTRTSPVRGRVRRRRCEDVAGRASHQDDRDVG
jgi:hypothetical protein